MELNGDSASAGGPSDHSRASTYHHVHQILDSVDPAQFDWAFYEGPYKGRALITRLNHIPSLILNSPNPTARSLSLARSALQRLLRLVKSTWDTSLYLVIISALDDTAHPERLKIKGNKGKQTATSEGNEGGDAEDALMEGEKDELEDERGADGITRGDVDLDWVEESREAEKREMGRLDVELRGYMSNLIKESIRLTYLAFAELALKAGKSGEALKSYAAAREFSTSPVHHVDLGVGILDTSLAFNQPASLPGHISKLEAALDRAYPASTASSGTAAQANANMTAADQREQRDKEAKAASVRRSVGTRIRVAKGLVALQGKGYETAGRELGEVGEEGGLDEWEGQAISTNDIALITALCTIATSSRERVRRVLLDRASFRSAVADEQGWLIDLVRAFVDANYAEVGRLLAGAENRIADDQPTILLNPFLSPHTSTLVDLIQTRAVIQYVEPFSTIKVDNMAAAFGRDARDTLREVEELVYRGKIKGRVDLINGILEMTQANPRRELFTHSIKMGQNATNDTKAALLRMKLHEAKITVDPRPPSDVVPADA